MMLQAEMVLTRGALLLDLALHVAAGETVALVGPNGAGKSSCLLALAGLLRIDRGRIALGGRVLDAGPGGVFLPPEERGVGIVFQDHLLFPHLTALENVAYGPISRGAGRRDAARTAAGWLERVGVADCAHRKPGRLSGGQAQRVALARALACSPRLLLLDEPLTAVDASARIHLRQELRRHLAEFEGARIVVAHDMEDALALAGRIVVVEDGRVVQAGTLAEIAGRPASRYVADLVGVNSFRGHLKDGVARIDGGGELVAASEASGPVVLTVHPRAIALFRHRPDGSPRNAWAAPVVGLVPALDRVRVHLGGPLPIVAEVTHAAVEALRLAEGGEVWVAIKATEIAVTPA